MIDFESDLATLCIQTIKQCEDDPEQQAEMIRSLASSLAYCVVRFAQAGKYRQELLTAIEQMIYEDVASYVRTSEIAGKSRLRSRR